MADKHADEGKGRVKEQAVDRAKNLPDRNKDQRHPREGLMAGGPGVSRASAPPSPPSSAGDAVAEERVVALRPRSILVALGIVLGVAAALGFLVLAQSAVALVAVALFLALALNPAVEFFQRRGLQRGLAVAAVYAVAVVVLAVLAVVFITPLVTQVNHFVKALPGFVGDLTKGQGPLGFLERKYHVVEEVRKATMKQGGGGLSGAAMPALGVAKGVASGVGGLLIIAFLTLFMLLEGPEWRARILRLIPAPNRPRAERIGAGVYRSVGGFVTGNLFASFLAGVFATILLLIVGVPYAVPLGLFTLVIELIPYLGPALVTVLLGLVALTTGPIAGVVVFALMTLYHVVEGHSLRPLIYGRALKLSALAVLTAILVGTEVGGVLGALAAIPVAGSMQVIVDEILDQYESRPSLPAVGGP